MVIETFKNEDLGIEARVIELASGNFNVILRDTDADDVVGGRCGIKSKDAAIDYAKSLVA